MLAPTTASLWIVGLGIGVVGLCIRLELDEREARQFKSREPQDAKALEDFENRVRAERQRLSAGMWKRAEKKAFGLLRLGEQKRKSA